MQLNRGSIVAATLLGTALSFWFVLKDAQREQADSNENTGAKDVTKSRSYKYPRPEALPKESSARRSAAPALDLTALTRRAQEKWQSGLSRGKVLLFMGIPRYAVLSTDNEIDWAASIPPGGYELVLGQRLYLLAHSNPIRR